MRRPSLTQSIGLLAAVSVVAGVIMAAMLVPFVGGIGLAAKSATDNFTIPSFFKRRPLPQVSTVVADDGTTPLATFYDQDRFIVHLTSIPLVTQQALIDTEDVRFYEHQGLDWKGAVRALLHNGSGGGTQGGSTLEQQYVKNVLVENARTKKERLAATADTLARKINEARYAIYLDQHYTKSQILEDYFNIVYFGDGAYGIGAAARHFFSEPVSALTLTQSALLIGLVQSPEAYNPRYYPVAAKQRRDVVLGQMLKYGSINQSTYDKAVAKPIKLTIHSQGNDCVSSKNYPYFCDYVKHVFENTPGLGLSLLRRGGLTVTTTLNPKIQQAATQGVHAYVHEQEPTKAAAAEAVVQPGTGKVQALAVSTKYGNNPKKGENSINYAVDQKYGGSQYGFHAGSTFKLFVLAAALKEGIPISTRINAPSTITVNGYTDCAGNPTAPYALHNAGDSESGSFNLDTGTWFSVNTFYAQLEQRTGLCEPIKLAEAMGVHPAQGGHIPQLPSFVLGSAAGFTPLDVAGAYATMAAHGKYCKPIAITKIVDQQGNTFPTPKAHCTQVVPPDLANTVTSILHGVLTVPGATGTADNLSGRPAAAKTGTVDNYDGSWFAGYTPQLAAAVWAGIPAKPNESLGYKTIGGISYGPVFGATLAGKIWQSSMNAALQGEPVVPFAGASNYYSVGQTTPVPDVSGDLPGDAAAVLRQDGFSPVVSGTQVASTVAAGRVARTSPGAGAGASAGATIYIYISNGKAPKPTKTPGPAGHTSSPPPASPSSTPTNTPPPKPGHGNGNGPGHGHGPGQGNG